MMKFNPKLSLRSLLGSVCLALLLSPGVTLADDQVQDTLARIEAALQGLPEVGWLPAPFSTEEAREWAMMAGTNRAKASEAINLLQQIGESADLPLTQGTVQQGAAYDRQDLGRLQRFAELHISRVDEAVNETNNNVTVQFDTQNRELEYFRELDPENPNHRSNAFLADGAQERVYGQLQAHARRAESVAAWQRTFGMEPSPVVIDRINEIQALRERYAQQRALVLESSRLPDAASDDPQLLSIAQQILANPAYEFGNHGPVILTTAAVTEHEREVSRAEIREMDVSLSGTVTLSGTQTTWHYRWQEFRFTTPIQDAASGNWHLWWITARNYSSGWEGTPIGRWVSAVTVQGDLIPEANFR